MTPTRFTLCWALLAMLLPHALAQAQLPAPSRTIYKCQVKGSVSYSDAPCVGAQRLDVLPTRGADRLSGSRRTGSDVANEIRSEQFAQALKPLTGMRPSQFATASRRQGLDAASQGECRGLEAAVVAFEQAERNAAAGARDSIRQDLFLLRTRYRKLGC